MTYEYFSQMIQQSEHPILLIEGKRIIPEEWYHKATALTARLAAQFPRLLFRSGNADGTDEAFSNGVKEVDPSRLQIVAPYRGHKQKKQYQSASYVYPDDMTPDWGQEILKQTLAATPGYAGLMASRHANAKLEAKARYIIRDTMKVAYRNGGFHAPTAALFYVNQEDPDSGGTGHTIRVCRNLGIPVLVQDDWGSWY